ncbi:MAG: family 16 glycoside hydrolase, partial [Armatimonadota bacterium]
ETVITLKRRPWRIALLQNGRLLCRAYDDEYRRGKVGYALQASGVELEEPFVQPIAPIYMTDDFTRGSDEPGDWEAIRGDWGTTGVGDEVEKAELSANPFAYGISTPSNALAAIGHPFWDDYTTETSVRGAPGSAIGLCARLQDGDSFLLFRWAAAVPGAPPTPNAKQLVEVVGGQWRMLASAPGGYVPHRWYRLKLRVQDDAISAFVDGTPVLSHEGVTLLEGRAGLYATGRKQALFDDLWIEGADGYRDRFSDRRREAWQAMSGRWSVVDGRLKGAAVRGAAMAVLGPPNWDDISFGCRARPGSGGGLGVLFRYGDSGNYYLFRWGTKGPQTVYKAKQQLVRVVGGQKQILAEAPGACETGRWHQIHVLLRGGHIRVFVDGALALESGDGALRSGKIGFYGEATKGVNFDDLAVTALKPRRRQARVVEKFTEEATMSGWASPAGAWIKDGDVFWNRADLYGPSSVVFRIPREAKSTGTIAALLRANGKSPESGYQLSVATEKGSSNVTINLKRQGDTVATHAMDLGGGKGTVEVALSQRGGQVLGEVGGSCVVQLNDPDPLAGIRGGIVAKDVRVDLDDAHVFSQQLLDYTFTEAPTDWAVQNGTWHTMDRWPCYRGWAWFGGAGHKVPLLWSKRVFEGDMTLEFYAAIQMDLPEEPGYSHASDINCTICGDGQRIGSGYSFIFAGFGNKASAILRKDDVVAKSNKFKFDNPVSMNVKTFQRHWFHIRVEKRGGRLRFFIDDELALEYEDPEPLPGGRVGFWTYDNGLIIARARVSYEEGGQVVPLPILSESPPKDVPYSLYEE